MSEQTFISIKDYDNNEQKVGVYKETLSADKINVQRMVLAGGFIESPSSDFRIIEKESSANIICPVSWDGVYKGFFASKFVLMTKFYDYTTHNQVIGTGDGNTTDFTATLTNTPIIPNSLVISYSFNDALFYGYDEFDGGDETCETGTLYEDCAGAVNYRSGSISVSCNNPPDNYTDVTVSYKQFSTTDTDTNIQLTPYLFYVDDANNKHTLLKIDTQNTLSVVSWPSAFKNTSYSYRFFADYNPGGDATSSEDWYWSGESLVIENNVGANAVIVEIDAFTKVSSSATYTLFLMGI